MSGTPVCSLDDLASGTARKFSVDGVDVAGPVLEHRGDECRNRVAGKR